MTVTGAQIVTLAQTQAGDRYVFGAEADPRDPNPPAFDCSELVEWVCARLGVFPTVPDGAWAQWRHCTPCSRSYATRTAGALGFIGDGRGTGRGAITHVFICRGDGTTIEARGRTWGVGTWPIGNRGNYFGLIPGVTHRGSAPPVTSTVPTPPLTIPEDDMALVRTPDGSIYAASDTEIRHLSGEQMAHRALEGRQVLPITGEQLLHMIAAGRRATNADGSTKAA